MWFTKDLLPRRGARGRASGRVLAGVAIVASFAVTAALPLPAIASDTVSSAADAASASGATQAAAPDVIAPSAVVIDQVTGTVLYEKDADSARPLWSHRAHNDGSFGNRAWRAGRQGHD